MIGKIRLTSEMSEDDIFAKIRSVFQVPMADNDRFLFDVLQSTGGSNKTLVIPALSSSYQWTASVIYCTKECKKKIYIFAREPLKVRKILMCLYSGGIDRLFGHYM